MTNAPAPPDPPPGLGRMRGLAMAVLVFERVWPAIAPALGVICVVVSAALLDLPRMLPPTLHMAALAVSALAVLAALGIGVGRVVLPRASEADRRLEADTGLRHQPLAVLTDRPSGPETPLWAAHVARARAQIARLRLSPPRPMLAAADPMAIRALILVALAASLGIAGTSAPLRLSRAVHPAFPQAPPPPAPVLQVWITPPGYTGLPPIFLKPDTASANVPTGSHLQASLTGGADTPTLSVAGDTLNFASLDATSFQVETDLNKSGRLAVRRRGRELAGWDLRLIPNVAPVMTFPEPPGIQRGQNPQTRVPWQASHSYGVVSVTAELKLAERPNAAPLVLTIPLPGNAPKSAKGVRLQDLTAHPWAGLAVTVQLVGRDAPGLEGRSDLATMTLPERRFTNPVARAVVALRKELSLHPDQRGPVIADLERLSALPETWDTNLGGYLNLRGIGSLLAIRPDDAAVTEAQARMWTLALALEEGAADRAGKALEQARQELRDALEAEKRGEQTDRAEIERKTRELQEALQKRLEALAEQARRDPTGDTYNPDAHPLDTRDMQKLTDQMREDAKNGELDKEREKLAELEQMMEALKNARPERGQMTEREKQRAEKRQRGQEQMTALQDIVRRQGAILDHAQTRAQTRGQPTPQDNEQRGKDQQIQQALRRTVGELMQQYGDLTGEVPPNLGEADTAMREAGQALAQGREPDAASAAQKAIEALQKGGQSMRQQMARQFGRGQEQGEGEEGEGEEGQEGQDGQDGDGQGQGLGNPQNGTRPGDAPGLNPSRRGNGRQRMTRPTLDRDPLGRQRGEGTGGTDESGDTAVPEERELARSQALQEELRRRGADRTRALQELEYIERLLKQFP